MGFATGGPSSVNRLQGYTDDGMITRLLQINSTCMARVLPLSPKP